MVFKLIQAHEYAENTDLLLQMFRLRKRIFHDRLGWSVAVKDDIERDYYDEIGPAYLLWYEPDRRILLGAMRLMPTLGPTLLYDVFRSTFPQGANLIGPNIWEATRTCVDDVALQHVYPAINEARGYGLVCLATGECAVAHGIHSIVCNYEPHMKRVYRSFGAHLDELGRSDGFGKLPVACGIFHITSDFVSSMRTAMGIAEVLYDHPRTPKPQLTAAA